MILGELEAVLAFRKKQPPRNRPEHGTTIFAELPQGFLLQVWQWHEEAHTGATRRYQLWESRELR